MDAPAFDWTPVPAADRYRLQIAGSEEFTSVYYDESVERETNISLDSVLPGHTTVAYWRVRAEGETETSLWSDAARFVPPSAEVEEDEALVVDAPPVPLRPTEETPLDRRAAPFTWEPVPEASGYQLQVASTDDFDDPAIDLTFDQVTSITLCDALPREAPLYWRVRSLFRTTSPGPWSPPVEFATSPPEDPAAGKVTTREEVSPGAEPAAAGPVLRARTTRTESMVLILLGVVSFLVTLFLISLFG